MRPRSIIWFERLNLLALALMAPVNFLMWDEYMAEPPIAELSPEVSVLGVQGAAVAFTLLLVLMVSWGRNRVFKWIYVVLFVLGIAGMAFLLPEDIRLRPGVAAITVVQNIIYIIAVVLLFRPDARSWLAGKVEVDPEIFR